MARDVKPGKAVDNVKFAERLLAMHGEVLKMENELQRIGVAPMLLERVREAREALADSAAEMNELYDY